MYFKNIILLSILLMLILANSVSAVTVTCGNSTAPGDYIFPNRDSVPVRVFIDTAGTSISVSPNNFIIPVGQTQFVQLRASTDTFARLFVTYTDTINNFSATLECRMFARSWSSYTTTTVSGTTSTIFTTTTASGCSSYTNPSSCTAAGCSWIGPPIGGSCIGSVTSTTTTIPSQTTSTISQTTTTSQSTTTIRSNCSGRSYSQCISTPGCRWIGNTITGYCESIPQTTTTSIQTTSTILQTTTQTTVSQGNTGNTGRSSSESLSSGSTRSSSSGSSKSTGFYDFPLFIQIPVNGTKTIKGKFYASSDLNDIEFSITGLDNNWYTISPSFAQKINKNQTINITISFNIPENTKQDSYVFKLIAKSGTSYEKTITLAITEFKQEETVNPTTTTILEENKKPTGFFVKVLDIAKNYWYAAIFPLTIITTLYFLKPKNNLRPKSKGISYSIIEDEQDYTQDYLEVRLKEPPQQHPEIKEDKSKLEKEKKIREKVIREIRERAMSKNYRI